MLRLIARGYTYKEIASELYISVKTVESHVSSVLRKLQLSTRHQLTRCGHRAPPDLTRVQRPGDPGLFRGSADSRLPSSSASPAQESDYGCVKPAWRSLLEAVETNEAASVGLRILPHSIKTWNSVG